MFSVHLDRRNIGNEAYYAKNWKSYETADDAIEISSVVVNFCISPILWEGGWRGKKRFLKANWLGLDFDAGMALHEAVETFKELAHVIGTTKHHGIAKGSQAACDRFRVFLKLERVVCDVWEYENTARFYVKKYGADFSAVDGARKFNPCREIISAKNGGVLPLAAKPPKPVYKTRPKGEMAPWILRLLQHGVDGPGVSRNTTCYKLGIHLTRANYSVPAIVDMIMNSPIPIGPQVRDEVERAVLRGSKHA